MWPGRVFTPLTDRQQKQPSFHHPISSNPFRQSIGKGSLETVSHIHPLPRYYRLANMREIISLNGLLTPPLAGGAVSLRSPPVGENLLMDFEQSARPVAKSPMHVGRYDLVIRLMKKPQAHLIRFQDRWLTKSFLAVLSGARHSGKPTKQSHVKSSFF